MKFPFPFPFTSILIAIIFLARNVLVKTSHNFFGFSAGDRFFPASNHQSGLEETIGPTFSQLATLPLQDLEGMDLQSHGTTTLAFQHQNSIFICVDSKASLGSYVGSKTVRKLLPISSKIVATMAGGAADCFHFIRSVSMTAKLWEYEYDSSIPVSGIAKILAGNLKKYRNQELSVGTMIAGYDEVDGASLFYVDSGGNYLKGKLFCVGSGSILAYSILDSQSRLSDEGLSHLSREEAIQIAMNAVKHATMRDGFSGGYINLFEVNRTGTYHLQSKECQRIKKEIEYFSF